eukprot:1923120-Amphidinium_carterae.1
MVGRHLVKSTTSTQAIIALSSAESEFAAMVKGISNAIGLRSLATDLGQGLQIKVYTDSSGAKGIASRKGIAKLRHLHTSYIYIYNIVVGSAEGGTW